MKKICIIIFSFLVVSGCNKEEVQPKKVVVRKSVITEAKEYYIGKTTYINHDDYFEHASEEEESLVVQVSNNYEVVEEIISYENEFINNEVEEINDEDNNIEEIIDSSILAKEEKPKEESNELIKEECIVIEETGDEKLSSNMEIKDNNIQEENNVIEIPNEVIIEELEVPVEIKTGYYAPNGNYLGETKVKVIDVSYYQGNINWDVFAKESDCYGVILRLGYYDTLDKKFERNINELKRLNIPYGIYLFSYATTLNGSNKEAQFTNEMIDKYELNPILGIYYDIESWSASNGASSNYITKEEYDIIISNYMNKVSSHVNDKYKVKVYSGRWYAMNRLGAIAKSYVDWVAEYNSTLKYDSSYTMWQYTSKGSVPGINGNVDISYLY